MKPSRYCLIGFCLFKVSGSLQEFIWSVAENETATLFPRLIILIPLPFFALISFFFFVCLQNIPFLEIKAIRLDLKMRPGCTNFHSGTYFVLSATISSSFSACTPLFVLYSQFIPLGFFFCFIIFFHPSSHTPFFFYQSSLLCFWALYFMLCPFLTSPAPSFSLSLLQCFHHFCLIPSIPLPAPIHIFTQASASVLNQMCSFQHFNKLSRGSINVNHSDHIVL